MEENISRAGTETTPSAAQSESVTVHGTRTTMLGVIAVVMGVGIGAALVITRFSRLYTDVWGYAGGSVLGGAAIVWVLWSVWRDSIREVTVSPAGVRLRTGQKTFDVPWSALLPFREPVFFGEIGLEFRVSDSFGPDNVKVVNLTRRQAKAIVEHPSCPAFALSQSVRQSLGLLG